MVAGSVGASATLTDLAAAYVMRGEDLVACDLARQAAVQTLKDERRIQDR